MGCVQTRTDDRLVVNDLELIINGVIAEGGFSQILLARDRSKRRFAIKRIECTSKRDLDRANGEIQLHIKLGKQSAHLVELLGHQLEERNSTESCRCSLIFPFYRRGSLLDELQRRKSEMNYMSEQRCLQLFGQVCEAVSLLHHLQPSIAHRDVKPGNVLLADDDSAVLIDLGSACQMPQMISTASQRQLAIDEAAEQCSMAYRAPELFTCDIGSRLTTAIDIWSLACLLFALCIFRSPFDAVHERGDSVALAVQSPEKHPLPSEAPFGEGIRCLISDMLIVDSTKRPTIDHVLAMLEERRRIN